MSSASRLVLLHANESPAPWRARWIREPGACRPKGVFYAKRVFNLGTVPRSATIHVAAHTRYTLYCNGVHVGRGPVRATHRALFFDSYDIADLLKEGENVLAAGVMVFGVPTYVSVPFEPGLAVEGEIEVGGAWEPLCTDSQWRVIRADAYDESATKYTFQAGWGEVYCADKEIEDWVGPSLNGWQTPDAIALDEALAGRELRPRMIPAMLDTPVPARRIAEVALTPPCRAAAKLADYGALMHDEPHLDAPERIVEGADAFLAGEGPLVVRPPGDGQGVLVALDLGGEAAGRLDFEVEGPGGAIMDIGYNEDYTGGRLFVAKGDLDGKEYRLADRYVLAEGRRRHVQEFVFRAGRYVQLVFRGFDRPIKLHGFKMRLGVYPAEQRGRFTCSDLAHSRLYQAGVSTLQLCMWDTYLDCPWREQAMWVGDMFVEALYDHLVLGDPRMARQCLEMAAHGMRPDGLLRSAYPSEQATTIPSFSLLWILSVADYTLYTGDTSLLEAVKGEVRTLLETFGGWVRPDGLLDEPPELWNFYDWGHRPPGGPASPRRGGAPRS